MKKIMFNKPYGLEDAVIEGRKPITRRIVSEEIMAKAKAYQWQYFAETNEDLPLEDALLKFSPYKVGEVVAVAQAYKDCMRMVCLTKSGGWANKMFVKAELMPNRIRITNVRVEFLQDISAEDCLREGILKGFEYHIDPSGNEHFGADEFAIDHRDERYHSPRKAFAALIDKIGGKGTWDKNPYVFVYEFELVK